METKVCARCGRELPVAMFNKCSSNADGLYSYCKPCTSEVWKEHQAKKKEKAASVAAKKEEAQKAADANPTADTINLPSGAVLKKVKTLADYDDRELFAELKRRGWEFAKRSVWFKKYLDIDKIEV